MSVLPHIEAARIGGDVAVDFFNTVDRRPDPARRSDRLKSFEHVLAWMFAVDLLSRDDSESLAEMASREPRTAAREHAAARTLRDDTYTALLDGAVPTELARRLPAALQRAALVRHDDNTWGWQYPEISLRTPVDRLALELNRLVTSPSIVHFGRCDDDECGWVFLDTSRQHNRRWCSAADCGNRNRVRAYHRRQRTR